MRNPVSNLIGAIVVVFLLMDYLGLYKKDPDKFYIDYGIPIDTTKHVDSINTSIRKTVIKIPPGGYYDSIDISNLSYEDIEHLLD